KLLRREREAVGAFDPAAVYALAAAAQSDYPGNVIDRAIRENFAGLSLEQMNTVAGIFELEKAIIQSVPYWGTREASEVHFELKWLLERLPKRVVTNQVLTPELTGAAATVFLPIRHGMEHEALRLLDEYDQQAADRLVNDFDSMRDRRFG